MSQSTARQAVPIEFIEQLSHDRKLQRLVEELWSYGSCGMFSWFRESPTVNFEFYSRTVVEKFKKDYIDDYESLRTGTNSGLFPFDPDKELDEYCLFLKRQLEQIRTIDPLIEQRRAYLRGLIGNRVHSYLSEVLRAKRTDINDGLINRIVWGGRLLNSDGELGYIDLDQVKEIAEILSEVEMDGLIVHSRASEYGLEEDEVEELQAASRDLKLCFVEAAEREQLVLTTAI